MLQKGKTMESKPSLSGLCLTKTEKWTPILAKRWTLILSFPSFPPHLITSLQHSTVDIEQRETRVAGHFPATWAAMVVNVKTLKNNTEMWKRTSKITFCRVGVANILKMSETNNRARWLLVIQLNTYREWVLLHVGTTLGVLSGWLPVNKWSKPVMITASHSSQLYSWQYNWKIWF